MVGNESNFSEWDETLLRLEEIISHPNDLTYKSLQDRELETKKNLAKERKDLAHLLSALPAHPPKKGSKEHDAYLQTQKQIDALKSRISKKHDELMEILKNEERISREIQGQ